MGDGSQWWLQGCPFQMVCILTIVGPMFIPSGVSRWARIRIVGVVGCASIHLLDWRSLCILENVGSMSSYIAGVCPSQPDYKPGSVVGGVHSNLLIGLQECARWRWSVSFRF